MLHLRVTASQAILRALAADNRHVLSTWRALIYLRRATFELGSNQRRWRNAPEAESDITPHIRQMVSREELRPLRGLPGIYLVTAPYAREAMTDSREVLFEAHAYTVLSHFTALEFHGLTIEQPKVITATSAVRAIPDVLPLGTDASDWEDIPLPSRTRPSAVLGQPSEMGNGRSSSTLWLFGVQPARSSIPNHLAGTHVDRCAAKA